MMQRLESFVKKAQKGSYTPPKATNNEPLLPATTYTSAYNLRITSSSWLEPH